MKRSVLVVLVAGFLVLASVGRPVQGYNPGGHVYIAEHALFTLSSNALYGSMAPDIIGNLPEPARTLLEPNHLYFNLIPLAATLPEKMFALGWMTHNSQWGTDFFAHVNPGYVVQKGNYLATLLPPGTPQAEGIGHIAVEMAVDILLKKQDPLLPMKVYQAGALRSQSVAPLLYRAGVFQYAGSDLLSLDQVVAADAQFAEVTKQYALALGASSPRNLKAMATFASAMASEVYGLTISAKDAKAILAVAIELCEQDYLPTISAAIQEVQYHVWHGDF